MCTPVNSTQIMIHFKQTLTEFLDDLIQQFPSESNIVIARIFIIDGQVSMQDIMDNFMTKVLPYKKMIDDRNETFFLEHDSSIFGGVANSEVNHFKQLWLQLDEDSKYVVWKYFDLLVSLSLKYKSLISM